MMMTVEGWDEEGVLQKEFRRGNVGLHRVRTRAKISLPSEEHRARIR
jgi:hypothetical protein